jgi:hypothetical protein
VAFRLNFSTGGRRGRITPKGVTEILTDTRALLDTDLDRCAWHVDALVGSRLADARAHAERSDLPTAKARLGELGNSLIVKIRDARAHFYRRSFALHRATGLDQDVHQVGLQPTPEGEHIVRNAKILGRVLEFDVDDLVRDSAASLTSVILSAEHTTIPASAARAMWSSWQDCHHRSLVGLAKRELSDAQIAIHEAVGRMFLLPNLR